MDSQTLNHVKRTGWDNDFPELFKFSVIEDRRENEHYFPAKKEADIEAGLALAEELMPFERIEMLIDKLDHLNPVIMPIHALEITNEFNDADSNVGAGLSQNVIPVAMAIHLHRLTGWDIESNVIQSNVAGRTGADGLDRYAFPAMFDGEIQKGRNYIILDDHVSMAGTLASAKGHIESNGGKVVAVSSLTANRNSLQIGLTEKNLKNLRTGGNFYKTIGKYEENWKNAFGYGYDALTNAEGKWLMDHIRIENQKNSVCARNGGVLYTVKDMIERVTHIREEYSNGVSKVSKPSFRKKAVTV